MRFKLPIPYWRIKAFIFRVYHHLFNKHEFQTFGYLDCGCCGGFWIKCCKDDCYYTIDLEKMILDNNLVDVWYKHFAWKKL